MSIDYKIWDFPTVPIAKQAFFAPGTAVDGGFTVGGSRITSPEPGGRGSLQIQLAMQTDEWTSPATSWLMSMTNGEILRVRLAPTPQICRGIYLPTLDVPWDTGILWSNLANWEGDMTGVYKAAALEGSNQAVIDMSSYGQVLQRGHVIGHKYNSYLVKDISYDANNVGSLIVSPPFRYDVAANDTVLFRPYFTGSIVNGTDIQTTYDAENVGMIQPNTITLSEVNV